MNAQTITERIRNLPRPFPSLDLTDWAYRPHADCEQMATRNQTHDDAVESAAALVAPLEQSHGEALATLAQYQKEMESVHDIAQRLDAQNPELPGSFTGVPSERIKRHLARVELMAESHAELLAALKAAQRVLAEIVTPNPTISDKDAYIQGKMAETKARAAIANAEKLTTKE